MGRVSFIPAQIDGLAASTSRQSRDSPLFVMYHDIQTLARNALYLPLMMMPLNTMDPKAETYPNSSNLRDMSIHLALIVLETTFLVLAVPAFLVLPGLVSTMIATTTACVIGIMCLPMMGPRHMRSNTSNGMSEQYRHVSDERWIFMNGCMTSSNSLQAQIDRLSQTFGRPILGIHNRSYGLIADLLECFLQRALNMTTTSSRATYEHLKAYVLDPTITKVVCIAHSQGALSLSIVLDRMLAELPTDVMAKLEIYTFGSAAAHFNNPLQTFRTKGSASGFGQGVQDGEGGRRHIPYIEHYTNQYDMLARFGVLNSMMQTPEQTHCGRVFMRASAAGSLMNQHYMNTMFPLSRTANTRLFLDEVVDVDEATAMRRESIIEPPQDVGDDMGLKSIMTTPRKNNDANGMKINFLDVAKAAVEDAKGKTVRDLSRLWRYQGGAKVAPLEAGFGAALMNGIVNPLKNVREREGK